MGGSSEFLGANDEIREQMGHDFRVTDNFRSTRHDLDTLKNSGDLAPVLLAHSVRFRLLQTLNCACLRPSTPQHGSSCDEQPFPHNRTFLGKPPRPAVDGPGSALPVVHQPHAGPSLPLRTELQRLLHRVGAEVRGDPRGHSQHGRSAAATPGIPAATIRRDRLAPGEWQQTARPPPRSAASLVSSTMAHRRGAIPAEISAIGGTLLFHDLFLTHWPDRWPATRRSW